MGAAGSILGGGFTLGSVTTLGGGSGGWPWKGKTGTGRVIDGTSSGVGENRAVDEIKLEKSSRSLEIDKRFSWWTVPGTSFMVNDRKLSAWNMRLEGDTVGWMRYP